jgi:tRNA pseudouridine38-40 synthase
VSKVGASERNLKITLEYDGTNYAGWQTQKHKTIQATLEKTLRRILSEKIKVIGSGRTDSGVHARGQIANFKTNSNITLEKLQKALNSLLPKDIAVSKVEKKDMSFHSRFDAKSKVYRYTILNRAFPSALLKDTVYFYPYPLNINLMQKESKVLLGRHNFKSFQASDKTERDAVKIIKKIKLSKDKDLIHIDIEADGFLYNMARNITGTLIEIGRGKFLQGSLKKILRSRNRKLAGPTAPAKGLCLLKVKYN